MPNQDQTTAADSLSTDPKTITLPMADLPGCKVGDEYTVKAVDGDTVTLEVSAGEPGDDWGGDLAKAAPAPTEGM